MKRKEFQVRTLADLAKVLGLSQWTVSRALNDCPRVGEATRRRVREAARLYGYEANPLAKGLLGKSSRVVGVTINDILFQVGALKLNLVERMLAERGYRVLVSFTQGDVEEERRALRQFLHFRVDGIVQIYSHLSPGDVSLQEVEQSGVVRVSIDPFQEESGRSYVFDREWAMHLLLEHLHRLGHRSYGIVGIHRDRSRSRWRGLEKAFHYFGIDPRHQVVELVMHESLRDGYAYGWELGEHYLSLPSRPTALLCLDDEVALGCISFLQQSGVKVPEDVSVCGFDDIPAAAYSNPPLTTVSQQVEYLVSQAMKALYSALELSGEGESLEIGRQGRVTPVLRIRKSTGVPPAGCNAEGFISQR